MAFPDDGRISGTTGMRRPLAIASRAPREHRVQRRTRSRERLGVLGKKPSLDVAALRLGPGQEGASSTTRGSFLRAR